MRYKTRCKKIFGDNQEIIGDFTKLIRVVLKDDKLLRICLSERDTLYDVMEDFDFDRIFKETISKDKKYYDVFHNVFRLMDGDKDTKYNEMGILMYLWVKEHKLPKTMTRL